jgi:hypothetical protein
MRRPGTPIVRFFRLIDEARLPQRADRSAAGTLPTRAYRYCEAVTSATAFGWWAFLPIDIELLWDGHEIFWRYVTEMEWLPLQPAAQFPDFAVRFDATAPSSLAGCSPPFLTALPEPGTLQIWTGLMARTAQDWGLLIRAPANLPGPGGYALYEGIIDSDRWFGPLITNMRLTRTHSTIRLRADFPLVQVQPLPRIAFADSTLAAASSVADMRGLTASDWAEYEATIATPNADLGRPFGAYAVSARKRRRGNCPIGAMPA